MDNRTPDPEPAMKAALINAILANDPQIMPIFAPAFDTSQKWLNYLQANLVAARATNVDVTEILDMPGVWHSDRFQALYVACWAYHPVEKGSYMIQLTPQQLTNAQNAAGKLTWRKSSHLEGTSRSARGGADFKFILGYGELLVMVHNGALFLKMEGHAASSPAHLASWYTKNKTGAGNTASAALNNLATGGQWGIQQRGAENYGTAYKALLSALGFSGKVTTVKQVMDKLQESFAGVAPATTLDGYRDLLDRLEARFRTYAQARALPWYQPFMTALPDLRELVKVLDKDAKRLALPAGQDYLGVDRVYREIRVVPSEINRKVQRLYHALLTNTPVV
jgi:hypothetical protein